ncbi:amidase [Sporolactobacillus kofuensis]|uniref:Amidase n=1 Tax=Sporolactobacillus kofuensis TaxID=269672 RepID=A0ABW1WBB7_9BACL|nr:amidase [Sporolactobacillus kofuensis]MCO7174883.1 aspartyl/glutamyl-tRNA amidotransferase subunit A [Sporolactobacillus kofuensis]
MDHLFFEDIRKISLQLKSGSISSVEITEKMLDRIHKLDPALNAYIQVMDGSALEQAKKADDEIIRGNIRGPLHGVPIAIKDIFETKGSITTAGSKVLSKWKPAQDAVVVSKLKDAGAVIIGKTNLHEFAMGSTTENPHYGPTRNPWNLTKIPGGSSGGSAVAVAAGMCYGALGTDTGGSIRLPSSLCGIVGLKPTFNLVNRKGCVPLSWSFDHIGPMARTVDDCALILQVIVDPKMIQNHGLDLSIENIHTIKHRSIKIGICKEYFFDGIEEEIQMIVEQAMYDLEAIGIQFIDIKIPGIAEGLNAQKIISKSEAYTFHKNTFEKYPNDFGKDVQFRLNSGSKVLASEYIEAQRVRRSFLENVKEAMKECDYILSPTHSITPFDVGERSPEESINNIFDLGKTPIGNLLGYPVLTVPCGFSSKKLPVGMQIIGKPYSEDQLLSIGKHYEEEHHWTEYFEQNNAYLKMNQ